MRGILFGVVLLLGCATTTTASSEGPKTDANKPEQSVMVGNEPGLKVISDPADAELSIDGQSYGKVAALTTPISLKPGIYQVSLKREGYDPWRAEVAVGEKTEQLTVQMVKR